MQLATKLILYGPGSYDFEYTRKELERDAKAAHALIQALREFPTESPADPFVWLHDRANLLFEQMGESPFLD